MKINENKPPRAFEVGWDEKVTLHDCAHIELEPDEQVTFTTPNGGEYDVCKKDWGFYATPSLNSRLTRFNLRGVLVRNRVDQYFLLLVEAGKEKLFQDYVASERLQIVSWLDTAEALSKLDPSKGSSCCSGGECSCR